MRTFDQEEMAALRQDAARNPGPAGLAIVAQLHACTKQDVLDALGLDKWPEKPGKAPKPQARAGKSQRKKPAAFTQEQRIAAVQAVESGRKSNEVAGELGTSKDVVNRWRRELKTAPDAFAWLRQDAGGEAPQPAPAPAPDAGAKTGRPGGALHQAAYKALGEMDNAIEYMLRVRLITPAERDVLLEYRDKLSAFGAGILYAETQGSET